MTATSQKPLCKVRNEALFMGQIIDLHKLIQQERFNEQHHYLSIFCLPPPILFDTSFSPYMKNKGLMNYIIICAFSA